MPAKQFDINSKLQELTDHRTFALPVACYETAPAENPNGHVPLHWHEEVQFMAVVKGCAEVLVNEENVTLSEGEGLFINSGALHSVRDSGDAPCTYLCLDVSPRFILPAELQPDFLAPYIHATNLSCVRLPGDGLNQIIRRLHHLLVNQPPLYALDTGQLLIELWKNLLVKIESVERESSAAVKDERMKQMILWIDAHYTEPVRLEDIARAGQLSRAECCRYFNRYLKTSPMRYVTEYRIRQSLLLLKNDELSVTEAAYRSGFNSSSYFISQFRKAMHMTPLAFKKLPAQNG